MFPELTSNSGLEFQVGKSHSFIFHSACIWGLEMYPTMSDGETKPVLPPGSFITCSSDDTIRIWNLRFGDAASGQFLN